MKRTRGEQAFWDETFQPRLDVCLKQFKSRGPEYCAHQAREIADAALLERRRSQHEDHQLRVALRRKRVRR